MLAASSPSITAIRPPGCTPFSLRSTARCTWMNADTNLQALLPSWRRSSKYWLIGWPRSRSKSCGLTEPPPNSPAPTVKKKGRSPCGSGPSLGRKRPRRATVTGETLSLPHCSNIHCAAQNSRLIGDGPSDFPHRISEDCAYFPGNRRKPSQFQYYIGATSSAQKFANSAFVHSGRRVSEYRSAFPHSAKRQRTMGIRLELQGL